VKAVLHRVRNALITGTAEVCHRGGLLRFWNVRANRTSGNARSVQILAYHRVSDHNDGFLPAMSLARFRSQMAHLSRDFTVCSLEQVTRRILDGSLRENTVVVTFDDGYRDNYDEAFPVLREYGVPATIFLTTDFIGTDRILWHDRVFRALGSTDASTLRDFGPGGRDFSFATAADREASQVEIIRTLRTVGPDQRDAWVQELVEKLRVREAPGPGRLMLDWDEVREMRSHGIEFGSHTMTHPILSRVSTEQAEREIVESKRRIENETQSSVTTFAYPNGQKADYDSRTIEILRVSGYRCAVTTVQGTNMLAAGAKTPRLMEMKRRVPCESHPATLALKLALERARARRTHAKREDVS